MSSHSVFVVHLKSVNGYQRTVKSLCCALGQDDVFSDSQPSPPRSKDGYQRTVKEA